MTSSTIDPTTPAPAAPKKRLTRLLIGGGLVLAAAIGFAMGNGGSSSSAAPATPAPTPVTVIQTAPAKAPVTVSVTAPPVTVTAPPPAPVTVTAQPDAATADPNGPKRNGTYLVGSQITSGQWQCASPSAGGLLYWETNDRSGGIVDNGLDEGVAFVSDEAFSVVFDDCGETWTKVG